MKKPPDRITHLVPMIVIMGVIFFLSHQPGDNLYMPPFPWFDKVAHMAVYAVLGVTVLYAFHSRLQSERMVQASLLTLSICLFYGIGDEFHQSFIPGRFASFGDVVADTMGAVAAIVTWFLWKQRRVRN